MQRLSYQLIGRFFFNRVRISFEISSKLLSCSKVSWCPNTFCRSHFSSISLLKPPGMWSWIHFFQRSVSRIEQITFLPAILLSRYLKQYFLNLRTFARSFTGHTCRSDRKHFSHFASWDETRIVAADDFHICGFPFSLEFLWAHFRFPLGCDTVWPTVVFWHNKDDNYDSANSFSKSSWEYIFLQNLGILLFWVTSQFLSRDYCAQRPEITNG